MLRFETRHVRTGILVLKSVLIVRVSLCTLRAPRNIGMCTRVLRALQLWKVPSSLQLVSLTKLLILNSCEVMARPSERARSIVFILGKCPHSRARSRALVEGPWFVLRGWLLRLMCTKLLMLRWFPL